MCMAFESATKIEHSCSSLFCLYCLPSCLQAKFRPHWSENHVLLYSPEECAHHTGGPCDGIWVLAADGTWVTQVLDWLGHCPNPRWLLLCYYFWRPCSRCLLHWSLTSDEWQPKKWPSQSLHQNYDIPSLGTFVCPPQSLFSTRGWGLFCFVWHSLSDLHEPSFLFMCSCFIELFFDLYMCIF